jgi:hypothetical protein
MDANPRSVADLFNSQLRYVVPMFQRVCVWQQDPQWTTLWEDVAERADLELAGGKATPTISARSSLRACDRPPA